MKDTVLTYETTDSYGRLVNTVPNIESDRKFTGSLVSLLNLQYGKNGKQIIGLSIDDQHSFIKFVEDSVSRTISQYGKCNLFSECNDHVGRPMRRYVITDKQKKFNYILDTFAILDVCLEMNPIKRRCLLCMPRSWVKLDYSKFVPKIRYRIKIWNTPVTKYQADFGNAIVDTEYCSNIEHKRALVGYPSYYDLKEAKLYERVDYDIRRAIFDEGTNVLA